MAYVDPGTFGTPAPGTIAKSAWADAVQTDIRLFGNYVYVPPGSNSTGITTAAAAASASLQAIYFPPGTYTINTAITLTDVSIICDPGAIVNVPSSLGSGVAAITLASASSFQMVIQNLNLVGPGSPVLGTKTANCDGIKVGGTAKPIFLGGRVQQFDSGVVWANTPGQITHINQDINNNYYGIYCTNNGSGYRIYGGFVDGNSFANIATPATVGISSLTLDQVHMGHAPFGIYQEAGTPVVNGIFLQEVKMDFARLEAIGNGAVYSAATVSGSNTAQFADIRIINPGFSWSNTYKLGGQSQAYAINVPYTTRDIYVEDTVNVFTAGTTGVFFTQQAAHNAWTRISPSAAIGDLVVGSGGGAINYFLASRQQAASDFAYVSGQMYAPAGTRTTGTRPNGFMTCMPFQVETSHTFTAINCEVTSAGSAGALIRLGVYAMASTGVPGALVLDAGTVSGTGTGLQTISGLTLNLPAGWYHLAALIEGSPATVPTMRVVGGGNVVPGMATFVGSGLNSGTAWANGSAGTGGLPNPSSASSPTDIGIVVGLTA